ncbi:hypothetical protein ABDK56_02020 [Sphingomonas sp. ASV193]|uniref:hypothetical protein n=1 Tax=Sphingomonas sp. ASV193 TaxID=3144405 RepID=UPI0032E88E5E
MTAATKRPTAAKASDEAKGAITGAYDSARDRALDAYDTAREKAAEAQVRLGEQLATTPLIALAGGLAVGALAGALLKRTKAEQALLGSAADRLTGAGKEAFAAAKKAGSDTLADLDITRDAGAKLVKSLIDGLGTAAKNSGQAAIGTLKKDG